MKLTRLKGWRKTGMNDNNFNYEVHRTKAGTIVELICALLMIIVWVVTGVAVARHENANATDLLVNAGAFSVIVALLLFLAYKPKTYNLPANPTERHYRLIVVCLRAVSVELALMFLFIQLHDVGWMASELPQFIVTAAIILTTAFYLFLIYRK